MKRSQVMGLFHANQTEETGEWIDIKTLPNSQSDKVKLKLKDLSECFAYYYRDPPSFAPSNAHFWLVNKNNEYVLNEDIIAWKLLKEKGKPE